MPEKQVLVSANWKKELRRLQKIEEENEKMERKMQDMQSIVDAYHGLEQTLKKFHEEYVEMKDVVAEQKRLAGEADDRRAETERSLREEQLKYKVATDNLRQTQKVGPELMASSRWQTRAPLAASRLPLSFLKPTLT